MRENYYSMLIALDNFLKNNRFNEKELTKIRDIKIDLMALKYEVK